MAAHRAGALVIATLVTLTACSGGQGAQVVVPGAEPSPSAAPGPTDPPATSPATTSDEPSTTTAPSPTAAPTTTVPPSTTTATTSTSAPPGPAPTTTTIAPTPGVYDPNCVVEIRAGDSLNLIAERFDDETVTAANLVVENGIADADVINEGDLLDVCVGNGLDDLTGEQRLADDEADDGLEAVKVQQRKLNELFAGYGIRELLVDGVSGPVTRQRLCAARLALGLPISRADMEPGSEEEQVLMEAEALKIPFVSAITSPRWVLIDRTCQIMFAGEGNQRIRYIFPTSTGEPGYETRTQDRSRAFRYDPAAGNGGWHNSTTFPVAIDNPLNGNMYKPIYFDGGQAIHGSNNVPRSPQSKGCARLRVADQDALVGWLGLADLSAPSWSSQRIDLTVNVQGDWAAG